MSEDRELMVKTNIKSKMLEDRLYKAEYIIGISDFKPKVFEDIYDKMSDFRADIKLLEQQLFEKVDFMKIKLDSTIVTINDCN